MVPGFDNDDDVRHLSLFVTWMGLPSWVIGD